MKNRIKISAIASLMLLSAASYSQSDSLGLPGDDLDLNAVLTIFKQSTNVEDFEKRLNSADPKINNLDLNNDGKVDYLRVVDYGKDNFHSLVIQDPVSKTESQDIAVIEVVKKDGETAHLQIVGDETLYGKNYIIEPADGTQAKTSTKNDRGYEDDVYNNNTDQDIAGSQVMVNVYTWPTVSYLYTPGYSYWVSPWYWGYYPGWYSPWAPYGGWYAYHRSFYGWGYGWYGYRTHYHAFPRAHNYYYGRRSTSGYVQKNATYGRRDANYNGRRGGDGQQRSSGTNPRVSNNRNSAGNVGNRGANTSPRVRNNAGTGQQNQNRSTQSNPTRVQGGNRIQSSPANRGSSQPGGGRINSGGGRVGGSPAGGGGGRVGGGGGGGGRVSGGGGGGRR